MSANTCDVCGQPITGYVEKKNLYTARRLGASTQNLGNKTIYRTAYEGFQTHVYTLCESCIGRSRQEDSVYKYTAWMFNLKWSFFGFTAIAWIIIALLDAGQTSSKNQFYGAGFLGIILSIAVNLLSETDFVQELWAACTVNGKLARRALYERVQSDPLARVETNRRKQYKVFGQRDYRRLQRF